MIKVKNPQVFLSILIAIMMTIVILIVAILPYQSKKAHAKSYALSQTKYMQQELKKGTPEDKVLAFVQARLTEEQSRNKEKNYTKYEPKIENGQCWMKVTILFRGKTKTFTTEKLKY